MPEHVINIEHKFYNCLELNWCMKLNISC